MENKRTKTRISALAVALVMLLSLIPITAMAEEYGMQGPNHKLQMTEPSDIKVNSATDTAYDNTINTPIALTDGVASFAFKMDAFGGQINNATDKVAAMQGKVDNVVTVTDASGSAVSGSKLTVTAVDNDAKTFKLNVSGLKDGTSYILVFPSSFTTGGGNWNLNATIKFNFTTASSSIPYGMQGPNHKLQMTDPSDITVNSATDTAYDNTINTPIALTDGVASFAFKMDAFGGQINNATDKVAAMQGKVDNVVTVTDAGGSVVSGSKLTVTAVDNDAKTFKLDVSGLKDGTSYILVFPSSFTTGGGNWNLNATIKFNFTTAEAAHKHTEEAIPAKEATCTETGLTEGTKCSVCGEVIKAQETIPAKGHTEEAIPAKEATCTETGLTEGTKCSVCGEVIKAQEEVAALGHKEALVPGKDATCTDPGKTDAKVCERCGDTLEEAKEIPALGHDYKDGVCTRCGAEDPDYVKLNGLEKGKDGKWALYKDNVVQKDFTGLAKSSYTGNWYYVKNGYIDWNYTGFGQNVDTKKWYRVKDGRVDWDANSIYKKPETGDWYKCYEGRVTFNQTGVYKNENGWWYCKNSKVDFNFTGIASNKNGTWYIKNGCVDFYKNGTVTYNGITYIIKNGKAQ